MTDSSRDTRCYHCGLPVPEGARFSVNIGGEPRPMCCPGCEAVASAIVDGGLERFYRFRTEANEKPDSDRPDQAEWQLYDLPEIQADFVTDAQGTERRAQLLLEGITCAACSWLIETHLKRNSSVTQLTVDVSTHRCTLTWDADQQPLSEIMAGLALIGYRPRPATDEAQRAMAQQDNRRALARLGVAGFGMMQTGMVSVGLYTGAAEEWQLLLRWLSFLVATPVVLFSAAPFFQAAWRSLRVGQLIMDVPVALAIGLAYLASGWATVTGGGEVYFESVAMFTFFLLVGRYFEMRTRHRNRLAYGNLAQLMPLSALRLSQSGEEESVPVKTLKVGDRVRVRSGETFPCDGEVTDGHSEVVEALLTGESSPVAKSPGDRVVGGTLNSESSLELRVTAVGGDTQLSAIERLVANAEADKPHQVALADRVARYFVGAVLVIFALVWGAWQWIDPEHAFWVALSVLVVTCPCALALAMPAALTAATANLRRQGFLIARGHVLEALAHIDRVILDKTGTLTLGRFTLVAVEVTPGRDREELLAIAAALEAPARHPLAEAFRPWAGIRRASNTRQYTAAGVEGEIDTRRYRLGNARFSGELFGATRPLDAPDENQQWLLLSDEQGPLGWFAVGDEVRPGARVLVAYLKRRGLAIELLSGDRSGAVASLAQSLGIERYTAGAHPEEKLTRLQACQGAGERVLMVGDGINDVPVLSSADVSVAMATASDLAQTRADAVLLNRDLEALVQALALAQRTRRVIRQNLTFSLTYNVLALPLAAMGLIPPWLAAIGMTASSLIVIFNALRLHRGRAVPAQGATEACPA
ncbi:heavy metal translocating P-type ATPase [Marinimicrobium locisalis]|uniref:heavy metal translocating P-type ATPase n=1 Tax=Marinimicrobium locisalis TaxID=546022 RepID=UPI0032218443